MYRSLVSYEFNTLHIMISRYFIVCGQGHKGLIEEEEEEEE
jgi:hypothetical protein